MKKKTVKKADIRSAVRNQTRAIQKLAQQIHDLRVEQTMAERRTQERLQAIWNTERIRETQHGSWYVQEVER